MTAVTLSIAQEVRTELVRKSIHILISLVPLCAALVGRGPTLALLAGGVILYTYTEIQRGRGVPVPLVTGLTRAAARPADFQSRVILGPITLGIGAMAALLIYPYTAAALAIYALAFGDSFSSIVGKAIGRIPLAGMKKKTLEGSMACFFTIFIIALRMSFPMQGAVLIALTATVLEAIPVKDLDNIVMPMGSGLVAYFFLS